MQGKRRELASYRRSLTTIRILAELGMKQPPKAGFSGGLMLHPIARTLVRLARPIAMPGHVVVGKLAMHQCATVAIKRGLPVAPRSLRRCNAGVRSRSASREHQKPSRMCCRQQSRPLPLSNIRPAAARGQAALPSSYRAAPTINPSRTHPSASAAHCPGHAGREQRRVGLRQTKWANASKRPSWFARERDRQIWRLMRALMSHDI
jgi:hypothetical protein